jgi:hypothetical protein
MVTTAWNKYAASFLIVKDTTILYTEDVGSRFLQTAGTFM